MVSFIPPNSGKFPRYFRNEKAHGLQSVPDRFGKTDKSFVSVRNKTAILRTSSPYSCHYTELYSLSSSVVRNLEHLHLMRTCNLPVM